MTESSGPAALYGVVAGIATITLNRPDSRNAMNAELLNALGDGLDRALADAAARVIVVTNAGPAFCAGADLRGSGVPAAPRYDLPGIFGRMQEGPKPVIGRIAGHCTGGGVGLAAACDISVAAADVQLGFTEVRIGVAPAIISVVCLPKMRRADAMELFLSGEKISAARAVEVGLLNRAVPREALDQAIAEIAGKLVLGGPRALAAAKSLVTKVPAMDRAAAFEWTAKLSADLFGSEEAAAGISAFREKKSAPWVP